MFLKLRFILVLAGLVGVLAITTPITLALGDTERQSLREQEHQAAILVFQAQLAAATETQRP